VLQTIEDALRADRAGLIGAKSMAQPWHTAHLAHLSGAADGLLMGRIAEARQKIGTASG
jgi:hypothetical protein